ncbi:hypothetical protein [Micromonospora sp. DT63]|uniref:hypothetical protein n=1 Tax=Micromonospora sp. DT63 TaxID=3393441 RepID=UPI003CE693F8
MDTVTVQTSWTHIGRLWTNGEPYLAVDAAARRFWRGMSNDEYDRIVGMTPEETSIAVAGSTALLVGADGVVRDDSWMEVFESAEGTLAIVQASGTDYRRTLESALNYPSAIGDVGDALNIPSGDLAIFSAALDGTGEHAMALSPRQPGPPPAEHGPPSREPNKGLLLRADSNGYTLRVRWYTEIDDQSCFARWLLLPAHHRQST